MAIPVTGAHPDYRRLESRLAGHLITPADAEYDTVRTVMAGAAAGLRPAAIARVANAQDVREVIAFAREHELELAVRSGGHSGAGHGTVDGGLVLDLREMKRLEIDPEARTAWAETGLTAGELTKTAADHGLAIGFGDTGSVGIGGITTGGGIGYLVRKHGMTIDNVMAAEVVTADGTLRTASAEENGDLFWAIRGGGGNFGVVTRYQFRLHPLAEIVGGILLQPATPEALAGLMAGAARAPEELSAIVNVMPCPPMPFVPEEYHGSLVVFTLLCWSGPVDEAQMALAPLRAAAEPIADLIGPKRYPELFAMEGEEEYHPITAERTMFVDHVGVGEAAEIIRALEASDAAMRAVQLRPLGGAMARVPADATAFAHRSAPVLAQLVAFADSLEDRSRRMEWVRDLAGRLDQGVPGGYVNFFGADDGDRLLAAYPGPTAARLANIKARYDPANVFRRNHNIRPADG